MNIHRIGILLLAAAIILCAQTTPAPSQTGGRGPGRGGRGRGGGTPVDALVSPDVHPDRTVTFRFRAPEATQVQLVGEIMQGKGPQNMAKDESGIWTITVGPLPPEIWIYNFRVQ